MGKIVQATSFLSAASGAVKNMQGTESSPASVILKLRYAESCAQGGNIAKRCAIQSPSPHGKAYVLYVVSHYTRKHRNFAALCRLKKKVDPLPHEFVSVLSPSNGQLSRP